MCCCLCAKYLWCSSHFNPKIILWNISQTKYSKEEFLHIWSSLALIEIVSRNKKFLVQSQLLERRNGNWWKYEKVELRCKIEDSPGPPAYIYWYKVKDSINHQRDTFSMLITSQENKDIYIFFALLTPSMYVAKSQLMNSLEHY